jgi:flagellar basal-body rod modification protein FlgD
MNIHALPGMPPALGMASMSAPSSGSPTTSPATLDSNSAEQTFIKLLVTELQSQDPTQPMDPTQMVGQMFSMNQLQQLIDINQTLSAALGGTTPSGSTTSGTSSSHNTSSDNPSSSVQSNVAASLAHAATLLPINAAASYAQQLLTGAH